MNNEFQVSTIILDSEHREEIIILTMMCFF